MWSGEALDFLDQYPSLLYATMVYVVATVVFLMNLLIAQLSCAYQATFQDMVGYARLNRGKIVMETMPTVPKKRWHWFLASLRLDERCEFGEGDLGVTGGIQVTEPANQNITTIDMIRRFGGSTSVNAQWPEEQGANDEEDRLERIEKSIEQTIKRISDSKKATKKGGAASCAGSSDQNGGSGDLDGGSGVFSE